MAKRKSRKKSYWGPYATSGRVVWGDGGFRAARKRVIREWKQSLRERVGPRTVASYRVDPDGGKPKTQGLRQKRDGTWEYKPPKVKTRVTARQRIGDMQKRVAEESDRHAAYLKAQKKPMTERVNRTSDGRFNGSDKATGGPAVHPSYAAYEAAVQAAKEAEARANRLLGY